MRDRKLKVYGGNLDGVHRVIMATTSIAAFAKATTCQRSYVCETGNEIERGVALNEPGVIFVKNERARFDSRYRRLGSPPLNWSLLRTLDQEDRNA